MAPVWKVTSCLFEKESFEIERKRSMKMLSELNFLQNTLLVII